MARKKFGRFTVKECWRPAVIRYCDRDLVEAGYGVRQVQRGQLKVDIGDKQFWQLNPIAASAESFAASAAVRAVLSARFRK